MLQFFLKLSEYLGVSPRVVSYFAVILITVFLTIPATLMVQGAEYMKTTLDTVVVNQERLEKSLSSIFDNVAKRIDDIEKRQETFYMLHIRSESIQNGIILDIGHDDYSPPVIKEKTKYLEESHQEFLDRFYDED